MKRHTIFITEEQAENLHDIMNDPLLKNVGHSFSIDVIKNMDWKNGMEIIAYCEKCGLLCLGEGSSRKVFQIDDERVLKIEKGYVGAWGQNDREVTTFRECSVEEKQWVVNIIDWDKNNMYPLWTISEQVLPASYADFHKIVGVDFGDYQSSADIEQMNQELKDYEKYDGKTVKDKELTLTGFLDAYEQDDMTDYAWLINNNEWFYGLYKILESGVANSWELTVLENWGLVRRNGQARLVILDMGI